MVYTREFSDLLNVLYLVLRANSFPSIIAEPQLNREANSFFHEDFVY
jgi:hypothetical protein